MADLSYEVKIRALEKRRDRSGRISSFRVRWTVSGSLQMRSFSTRAQADGFRSDLISASRKGEAFRAETGEPVSWTRKVTIPTWFVFAETFAKMKWPHASPNHRRSIAEALTDATEAMQKGNQSPDREELRAAMRWAFSTQISTPDDLPPDSVNGALTWLRRHTVRMDVFSERADGAKIIRAVYTRLNQTKSGHPAAANTANRKRMVVHNAFEYAREIGILQDNPLGFVRWKAARTITEIDPRIVVSSAQARRFLDAVEEHSARGARLTAFFGCMYYAGLRPEEAAELRIENLADLPATHGQWGELRITHSVPRSGSRWTDSRRPRERAPLKHRARGEARTIPMHPDLAAMIRRHLDRFGSAPDGHLFAGYHGGTVTDRTYLRVFHEARRAAFTPQEAESPLLEVPYALRHAAVSTWLRATGDPAQVAGWAGHSVNVLLRVYAKSVDGTRNENLQRILEATSD